MSETMNRHDWVCISPGEYDSTYECKNCGVTFMESADNPSKVAPEYGCEYVSPPKETVESVVKEIRKLDTGEWLKDCSTGLFSCADGREKRFELMRLLDRLYKAAGVGKGE